MNGESENNSVVQASDSGEAVTDQQKNVTLLVYILQAIAPFLGLTSIAGVIVNYLKRDEVRGTFLESHFDWQIKTFWFTLAGGIIGFLLTFILIGFPILLLVGLWYIYRVVKGWLAFNDGNALDDGLF